MFHVTDVVNICLQSLLDRPCIYIFYEICWINPVTPSGYSPFPLLIGLVSPAGLSFDFILMIDLVTKGRGGKEQILSTF